MRALLGGKDFKQLVQAVTKFPSIGNFAGSELVNIYVENGYATASAFSVIVSRAKIQASGVLPLIAVGEREIAQFASVCSDSARVSLEVLGKKIRMRSGKKEIYVPLSKGHIHKIQKADGVAIKITAELAEKLSYLSHVAYDDMSKAEVACVMLAKSGQAMAMNQKAVASLECSGPRANNVAIPIPLARIFSKGDMFYPGAKQTILKSGIATYCMPSPVKAQKEFPVVMVQNFGKAARKPIVVCDGVKLVQAVADCNTILGQVSRTEIDLELNVLEDKLLVEASNGGARFKSTIAVVKAKPTLLHVPLEGMLQAAPFIGAKTTIAQADGGAVYLGFTKGWCMFPAWEPPKKK